MTPYLLAERYGADALRYFLLRDFPFGSDGNFSNELLINRINMDLANDLGNLLTRPPPWPRSTLAAKIYLEQDEGPEDAPLLERPGVRVTAMKPTWRRMPSRMRWLTCLRSSTTQTSISTPPRRGCWPRTRPKPRLARVLYNLAETLRICTVLLQPFMPTTCEKIFAQLNVEADGKTGQRRRLRHAARQRHPAQGREHLPPHRRRQGAGRAGGPGGCPEAAAQAANAPAEEKEEKPAESGAASAELIGEHEEEITFDDFSQGRSCAWPRSAPASA